MPKLPTGDPELYYQAAPLLLVPDVTATAEYYRRVLGFVSDPEGTSPQYGVVWRDHAAVHFARGESVPSGVRIFFWVKDVDHCTTRSRRRAHASPYRSARAPIEFAISASRTPTESRWCSGRTGTEGRSSATHRSLLTAQSAA
jgi:hypothetical protein